MIEIFKFYGRIYGNVVFGGFCNGLYGQVHGTFFVHFAMFLSSGQFYAELYGPIHYVFGRIHKVYRPAMFMEVTVTMELD